VERPSIGYQMVSAYDHEDEGTFIVGGCQPAASCLAPCWDTLPADHSAGARVWFVCNGVGATQTDPYPADVSVTAKNLPENSKGVCDADLVSTVSLTTSSRAQRPYPPGNVRVTAGVGGDLTCSWSRRSRLHPGVNFQSDADVAEDGEGTVTVEILVGGAVKHTNSGLGCGDSLLYTMAERTADDSDSTKPVQFRLTPVNGSLTGAARTTDPVLMAP